MRNLPQNDSHLQDLWHHSLSTLEELEFFLFNIEELLGKYGTEAAAIISQELAGKRSRQIALKLGVLFHDIGKPQRKSVGKNGTFHFYGHQVVGSKLAASLCSRLSLSNKEINFVSQLVRQHLRPLHLFNQTRPSARSMSRFFKLGPEIFWPLLLLFAADHVASQKSSTGKVDLQPLRQRISGWLDFYYEQLKPREKEPSILSGHDIMKSLDLAPGPTVGKLLKTLTELQWEGAITTREDALDQAARLLKEMQHRSQKTGDRGQQADCS
jgi:poly(A) polymerase